MTTKELCRRTGITQRCLQWWNEHGIVACNYVERGFRDFDESQALAAAVVGELRRKGIPLFRVGKVRIIRPEADYLVIGAHDGKWRRWCTEQQILRSAAACPGPCLVVSLKDLRARLNGDCEKRGARP